MLRHWHSLQEELKFQETTGNDGELHLRVLSGKSYSIFWCVSINQSINIKTSPWKLTALQELRASFQSLTECYIENTFQTDNGLRAGKQSGRLKWKLFFSADALPAYCDLAADDFCHNWSITLSPYALLPTTQFKENAIHPSPAQMNCWWGVHLPTICFFPFAFVSIPSPSPLSHLPVSLIPYLLEHFPPSLHANTLSVCKNIYTDIQISSYPVQIVVAHMNSRGKQSTVISPSAAAVMVANPHLLLSCMQQAYCSIQRCSSKCTAHAFIFEMFCFCAKKTYIIIKKIMLHIKNRKVTVCQPISNSIKVYYAVQQFQTIDHVEGRGYSGHQSQLPTK